MNLHLELASWNTRMYQQTVATVLAFLFVSGVIIYLGRKSNYYFVSSWASLKSWLIAAPILFILMGLPEPWPLIVLTGLAILGAKTFFQIMGMFHRSFFVLTCYLGIIALALCIQFDYTSLYNIMPMLLLGVSCLVPLMRDSYKRMIQYISLTQLAFVFLGWSFMHLGLILKSPSGVYQILYLIILTEFCDSTNLATGRYFGGVKFFPNINNRRTVMSTLFAIVLTIGVAYVMRHLLPDSSERYWLTSGLVASIGGVFGDLVMTVVRRDAGVKVVGAFVIGRGDFLQRMDRLIFVAPIFYYVMKLVDMYW